MKRSMFKLGLVLTLSLLGVAGNASENLLVNGDFETGDFTGWTDGGYGAIGTAYGSVGGGIYSASTGGSGAGRGIRQVVGGLSTNTDYTFSASLKSTTGAGSSYIGMRLRWSTDGVFDTEPWVTDCGQSGFIEFESDIVFDWTKFSHTLNSGANTYAEVEIIRYKFAGKAGDDVEFIGPADAGIFIVESL